MLGYDGVNMVRLSLLVILAVRCATGLGKRCICTRSSSFCADYFFHPAFSVSSTPGQAINGIGASGAWWPNDLFKFPESVREQVAELLFSPSGAGLTSYRYNVGGGGVGVANSAYVDLSEL